MAKMIEEVVVITISKLVKNDTKDGSTAINDELLQTLETVAQELLGEGWVVEASTATV